MNNAFTYNLYLHDHDLQQDVTYTLKEVIENLLTFIDENKHLEYTEVVNLPLIKITLEQDGQTHQLYKQLSAWIVFSKNPMSLRNFIEDLHNEVIYKYLNLTAFELQLVKPCFYNENKER